MHKGYAQACLLQHCIQQQKMRSKPKSIIWMCCAIFLYYSYTCMRAKSLQLCMSLCDPMDRSPAGSSIMGFSKQKYWNRLLCPIPGDLSDPGIEPVSLTSSWIFRCSLPLVSPGKLIHYIYYTLQYIYILYTMYYIYYNIYYIHCNI